MSRTPTGIEPTEQQREREPLWYRYHEAERLLNSDGNYVDNGCRNLFVDVQQWQGSRIVFNESHMRRHRNDSRHAEVQQSATRLLQHHTANQHPRTRTSVLQCISLPRNTAWISYHKIQAQLGTNMHNQFDGLDLLASEVQKNPSWAIRLIIIRSMYISPDTSLTDRLL